MIMANIDKTLGNEESRIKIRILELGIRQKDIALALGIAASDVSKVVKCKSNCPKYKSSVYEFLGLSMP